MRQWHRRVKADYSAGIRPANIALARISRAHYPNGFDDVPVSLAATPITLPVILLEGTAIGLTLGRLYFFKGTEQRKLGHRASFVVWIVLAINTLAQFAIGYSDG